MHGCHEIDVGAASCPVAVHGEAIDLARSRSRRRAPCRVDQDDDDPKVLTVDASVAVSLLVESAEVDLLGGELDALGDVLFGELDLLPGAGVLNLDDSVVRRSFGVWRPTESEALAGHSLEVVGDAAYVGEEALVRPLAKRCRRVRLLPRKVVELLGDVQRDDQQRPGVTA